MRKATILLAVSLTAGWLTGPVGAEIRWRDSLREAHAEARSEGKLLLLHFYTDRCVYCDKLEENAFQTSTVRQTLNGRVIPVKIDGGRDKKLREMFQVRKFPTDVVVTTDGEILSHSVSPQDPGRYVAMIDGVVDPWLANQPAAAATMSLADAAKSTPAIATGNGGTAVDFGPTGLPAAGAVATAAPERTATPERTVDRGMGGRQDPEVRSNQFFVPSARAGQVPAQVASAVIAEVPAGPEPKSAIGPPAGIHETPDLAIQGFCPVSVIREREWVDGNPEHGVIHLGRLYLFASEEKMELFLQDPVPYTPVMNEIDVVRFFEERRIVPGKREWGIQDPVHGRMYFFADEEAMNHFLDKYELYSEAAVKVMERAVRESNRNP